MTYSIEVQVAANGPVIAVLGDADLMSADALYAAIEEAAGAHDRIVVDLSGATLLDSRTIGVLAGWVERLRGRGATMPIVCDDANVLRLFATIGLDREFEFFASRDDAGA